MSKLLIVSDHIIYNYRGTNYTSATILYPNNFDIAIFGRLAIANHLSEVSGMNIIPNNIDIYGYKLKKKGAMGYIYSILPIFINLISAIRNSNLIILKMPYVSSLFGFLVSFILKKNKIFYFIGFGGNNLRAKRRLFFANIMDIIVLTVVRFNKYNIYVSKELSEFYSNPTAVNLILPELQIEKYKRIKLKNKKIENNNILQLAYIGRFSEEKGVMDIPEILSGLSNIKLNLLGDGTLKQSLCDSLVQKNINFINYGWVKNGEDLFNIIKSMDFVLIPSKSEGFGLVAIEANLCGVPVIANNVGGLKGIVYNQYNGFLVKDNEEFREKIKYFSQHINEIESLRENSREFATNFLSKNDYQIKLKSYICENFNY